MSLELDTLKVIVAIRKTAEQMDKNRPLAYMRVIFHRVIEELGRQIIVKSVTEIGANIPSEYHRSVTLSGDFDVMAVYMNACGFHEEANLLIDIFHKDDIEWNNLMPRKAL